MYSIENNITSTLIIKKSKFITNLYKLNNINEISNILYKVKNEYKDSTHICYAYIFNNQEKCFDDNEPSGTAGLPILNILKKKNISNVLAIVIRYFGGIKLGSGGLIRAYSNSAIEALNKTNILELIEGYKITISFNIENIKKIDLILKNINIIKKEYKNNINYTFLISIDEYNNVKEKLDSLSNFNSIENYLINKRV